tara:strand:+ start:175 stop:384 length:210 start_codon:yes stop_codon:yes gene_type:complete
MKQKNELETLEHNINFWKKVMKIQEQKIKEEVFYFPISWTEYIHAKRQLERVKRKYGTTEIWEIKDLHR